MNRSRRRRIYAPFLPLESLDALVLLSVAMPTVQVAVSAMDDPLPDPEPSPGTDPGSLSPLTPPPLPPSGPIGPGTS